MLSRFGAVMLSHCYTVQLLSYHQAAAMLQILMLPAVMLSCDLCDADQRFKRIVLRTSCMTDHFPAAYKAGLTDVLQQITKRQQQQQQRKSHEESVGENGHQQEQQEQQKQAHEQQQQT
jgi:hypothetical protein